MPDLLTTDEAATYLRLSERKLYELVANGAVPAARSPAAGCFPRRRSTAGCRRACLTTAPLAQPAPPIVGGSHDPLLEWALRESGSGLATLPEGSEAGLRRLARGEVMAAAIHLHRIDGDDDSANAEAVANAPGLHDVVVIAFARREQGLLVAPGNPLKLSDIASVAASARADGAAAATAPARSFCCSRCWRGPASPSRRSTRSSRPARPAPTSPRRCARERADCGIATRAVALAAGLDFVPLTWERFDLALRQRDYFMPGPQALFDFLRTPAFRERAAELRGYDVAETGQRPPRQLRTVFDCPASLGLKKPRARRHDMGAGQVAEWLKALAWKACIRETVSWVRIPPCPPRLHANGFCQRRVFVLAHISATKSPAIEPGFFVIDFRDLQCMAWMIR